VLNKDRSTIYREIDNNLWPRSYVIDETTKKSKSSDKNNHWSPEQISGRLKRKYSHDRLRQIDEVVNILNNRPRKCLNYATPNEVFYGES